MSCTVEQMIASAASQIGFREGPNNNTKYGAWYGLNYQPYCDMGISWAAAQVGASDIVGKFAYCPSHVNWFKARGQWGTQPRRGAIVFFSWNRNGVADHVGIVEVANASPTTIEFNTSSGAAGSQSNGDGVYRRVRNPAYIMGYGYPAYSNVPSAPPAPSSWDGSSFPGAGAFVLGQSHPAVTKLGQMLVAKGFGKHYTVGPGPVFGEADRLNTQDFQRAQGWSGGDADGYPGPQTWARLSSAAPAPAPAPAKPLVSVSHMAAAIRHDVPAPTGSTSFGGEVLLVERALAAEGLLRSNLVDGSFGTSTVAAYAAWQRRLGYSGAAADGVPGLKSLQALGNKYGFGVVA